MKAAYKSLETGQQPSLLPQHAANDGTKRSGSKGLVFVAVVLTAAATAAVVTGLCYSTLQPRGVQTSKWSPLSLLQQQASKQQACLGGQRAAAPAAVDQASYCSYPWELSMNASAAISWTLWQTSRSSNMSGQAQAAMQTWRTQNPNLTATLHDDAAAAAFIRDFYGSEAYNIFQSFPLGVMRGDFWRYAVLYAYGGIYGDIDTQCIKPIQQWFPPRKQQPGEFQKYEGSVFVSENDWQSAGGLDYHRLSWDDCRIVIALENDVHFCQWVS